MDYEQRCQEIRKENEELLELFAYDMRNLSPRTINRHVSNVDLYINDFLLYDDIRTFDQGIYEIGNFLGEFFIRKCMWSTPATIKSTATSIKKFYKSMLDHKNIEKEDYDVLCCIIKENMDTWQSLCVTYNDPDEENPFFFF